VALSVAGFSFVLGPIASLVLVATILDHEYAHSFMMHRLAYKPGPVRLVPLIGAFVHSGRPMLASADIAPIYLAGPLAGILSAGAAAFAGSQALSGDVAHQVIVGAAVAVGLNLFNLLPVEPLDGGLVSRVLPYPALWLFPVLVGILLLYTHLAETSIGVVVLYGAIFVSMHKVSKWRRYVDGLHARWDQGDATALQEMQASFTVPTWERVCIVAVYGLTVVGGLALLQALARAAGWLA